LFFFLAETLGSFTVLVSLGCLVAFVVLGALVALEFVSVLDITAGAGSRTGATGGTGFPAGVTTTGWAAAVTGGVDGVVGSA